MFVSRENSWPERVRPFVLCTAESGNGLERSLMLLPTMVMLEMRPKTVDVDDEVASAPGGQAGRWGPLKCLKKGCTAGSGTLDECWLSSVVMMAVFWMEFEASGWDICFCSARGDSVHIHGECDRQAYIVNQGRRLTIRLRH